MVDKPAPLPESHDSKPGSKAIPAKCPECHSERVREYALINNTSVDKLAFDKVAVICQNCGRHYSVHVDGSVEYEYPKCKRCGSMDTCHQDDGVRFCHECKVYFPATISNAPGDETIDAIAKKFDETYGKLDDFANRTGEQNDLFTAFVEKALKPRNEAR